jgi:hypothetical protein
MQLTFNAMHPVTAAYTARSLVAVSTIP